MDISNFSSFIENKIGLQCKYNKRLQQLTIQYQKGKNTVFKLEVVGSINEFNCATIIKYLKYLGNPYILVAKHVNKIIAETLQKANIQYIDFSGNMFINTSPLFIMIKGESPKQLTLSNKVDFVLNSASIKTIFSLLVNHDAINSTYRDIAHMSNVALGSVNKTFNMLQKNEYLIIKGHGQKQLLNKVSLLGKWCIAYNERLRPKIILGKFSSDLAHWWQEINPKEFDFEWSGEVAAAKLVRYLKPQITTLYAETALPQLQLKYKLKKTNNGNIELLKKFWNFKATEYNENIAPYILVYADLLSSSDERNQETAEVIYDKFIKKHVE